MALEKIQSRRGNRLHTRAVAAPTSCVLIWRLKFNPRATLTTWLAEGPALKAKNLKEVAHQTSCSDMRLMFGCGIGYSQNRILLATLGRLTEDWDAESVPRAVASVAPAVGYWREPRSLPLAVLIIFPRQARQLSERSKEPRNREWRSSPPPAKSRSRE